jgi:hypothetical protein
VRQVAVAFCGQEEPQQREIKAVDTATPSDSHLVHDVLVTSEGQQQLSDWVLEEEAQGGVQGAAGRNRHTER